MRTVSELVQAFEQLQHGCTSARKFFGAIGHAFVLKHEEMYLLYFCE